MTTALHQTEPQCMIYGKPHCCCRVKQGVVALPSELQHYKQGGKGSSKPARLEHGLFMPPQQCLAGTATVDIALAKLLAAMWLLMIQRYLQRRTWKSCIANAG